MKSTLGKLFVILGLATTPQLHSQGTIVFDQQSATNPLTNNYDNFALYIQPLYQSFVPTFSSIGIVQLELTDFPDTNTSGAKFGVAIYSGPGNALTFLGASGMVYLPPNFNNDNIGFSGITNFYFATPIALTPGQTYFIQPLEITGDHVWSVAVTGDTYPNGSLYGFAGTDLWFREGITVPEPSDVALWTSGGLLIAGILGFKGRMQLPFNPCGSSVPVIQVSPGVYLIEDGPAPQKRTTAASKAETTAVYLTSGGSGSLTNSGPVPDGNGQCIDDTNALWLECTNEGGGNWGLNCHNATNG